MEIKVPSKLAHKFNEEYLGSGTPVLQKYEVNGHWFNALIQEYGPQMISLTNGFQSFSIEIEEVINEICEIRPVLFPDECIILECTVFDHENIPPGTILIDIDGTAFIVIESNPFYLQIRDHQDSISFIQAEIFFDLDEQEIEGTRLILPEIWLIERAEAYKLANMAPEEAEDNDP